MIMKVFGIAVLAVATVMAATSGTWASGGKSKGETKLRAALVSPFAVGVTVGSAEYESKLSKGKTYRKLEAKVTFGAASVGTQVKFLVNGINVGTATVVASGGDNDGDHGRSESREKSGENHSSNDNDNDGDNDHGNGGSSIGRATLNLRTPANAVPMIVKGSTITVCNSDGIVIAKGSF